MNRWCKSLSVWVLCGGLISVPSSAEDRRISAHKTDEAIQLDGLLQESAWKNAPLTTQFIQREPEEGADPSEITEIKILYSREYLYFGVLCRDGSPDGIIATEMRRDADLENNDYFEIILDTFLSRRNGFYFAVNPLGAKRDAQIRDNGSNINWDWDGIWIAAARRNELGWSAEIAIPFHTLRFSSAEQQDWGINFGRHIARKREELFWTPILRDYGREGQYKISYFGILTGLNELKSGSRILTMPYLIAGGKKPDRDKSFKGYGDVGLDVKYRLTSNLTVDFTANTDFAQVEADQEQFNLTRFNLFFPEKRGFFLEGADIFRMGERGRMFETPAAIMFFSRMIGLSENGREVPIMGGARVTGKAGKYDLGAMNILTDRISYWDGEDRIHIEKQNYSVFRVKRDLLNKSSAGFMLLSKDSLDSSAYNRGMGADFNLVLGDYIQCSGFAGKTFSPGRRGKDWAAALDFILDSDLFNLDLSFLDIGRNFNAEMGFVNRTDIRKFRSNFSIRPRPGILNIRKSFFFNKIIYIENHSGRLESRQVELGNYNKFQNGSSLMLSFEDNFEFLPQSFEIARGVLIPDGRHHFKQFSGHFESNKSRSLSLRGEFKLGQFFNGDLIHLNATGFLTLGGRFSFEMIYGRDQFDLPVRGGKFTANILAGRTIYSFSPDLFAKLYVQWNDEEDLFKSNFLIRWIYKPGANIYLIYNETREVGESGFLRDRVLMLKIGFLFNT